MKLKSYDPSNGELLGELEYSSNENTQRVIEKAKTAHKQWKSIPLQQRVKIIDKAFKSLIPHQEELAVLLCKEMGKKHNRGLSEVRGSIFSGAHYAKEAGIALSPQTNSSIEFRSLGVCAVISPWNYPLAMAVNLITPALVAGNTVVFKPSEETPLIADKFVALLNSALPDNVLNILHGDASVGSTIVASQDINLVAFTGSLEVGKKIMTSASKNLKRLVMELGGNDPMIVLDDANLDAAAQFAVASSLENSGQMCTSTERVYVQSKVAHEFIAKVKAIASQYKIGPWHDENTHLGPIINERQLSKIDSHVKDALSKGANLLLGGRILDGRYYEPTVITGMKSDMQMESNETFGPIVAISEFESIEEAISRANNSIYGLGAVVFGQANARAVANQLEAGMIGINKGPGGSGDSPWVGAKQSGYGFHGSQEGHRLFAQVTVVE